MRSCFYFGFIGLVMLSGACNPVRVFLEKDQVSSVRDYKTFMIVNEFPGKEVYNSPGLEDDLQKHLIEGLKERGFEPDINEPDLVVRYNTLLTGREKEVNTMAYNPWGWGMYNPWMWRNPYYYGQRGYGYKIEKYNLGEVVLDFIDSQTEEVILRISAVGEVNKPEQKPKNLRVSVDKILDEFSKRIN